uniref:Uncharacterized protein n=1 Tax=Oryza rufipogon TaxID=4529 RepID=A0A0E0P6M1_ORYRU
MGEADRWRSLSSLPHPPAPPLPATPVPHGRPKSRDYPGKKKLAILAPPVARSPPPPKPRRPFSLLPSSDHRQAAPPLFLASPLVSSAAPSPPLRLPPPRLLRHRPPLLLPLRLPSPSGLLPSRSSPARRPKSLLPSRARCSTDSSSSSLLRGLLASRAPTHGQRRAGLEGATRCPASAPPASALRLSSSRIEGCVPLATDVWTPCRSIWRWGSLVGEEGFVSTVNLFSRLWRQKRVTFVN